MGGKPCIRGMRVTVGMIVEAIAATGYSGCFGLEYFPKGDSAASLTGMRRLLPDR